MSDAPDNNAPSTPADTAPAQDAAKPLITFDQFAAIDLRVGTVVECTPHPNGDKLLVLQVDIGSEKRQILAGIRAFYQPEDLIGRQIIIVANLAPRKMRGLESQGMLLAASSPDDAQVVFVTPSTTIPPGSTVS